MQARKGAAIKEMIPKECKRLAEVDFPIAIVSAHAAREKSIRHGHPSTLHLWWARRPLASSRAILLGLLLPDPCDPHCPEPFKSAAREILRAVRQPPKSDDDLQKVLLWFIGSFANWDMSSNATYIEVARGLVRAAYPEEPPLVVDPFAGGGSIPLEALRLGCEVFASDLNPVACLILKVMLEDMPRHGAKLAEELRRVGAEVKREAEKELADLYPNDPDGATPIAYLWARTVRCESPKCGAEIPLARSFWLCKKASRKRALRHKVAKPVNGTPHIEFELFEPKTEQDVPDGTATRGKATCVACRIVLPPDRVRAQLGAERGGADVVFDAKGQRTGGARILAVVTARSSETGRHYRLPIGGDYKAVLESQVRVTEIFDEWERGGRQGACPVPDEIINSIRPSPNARGLSAVTRYNMLSFGDLFTARQKVSLTTFIKCLHKADLATSRECSDLLALAVGRLVDATASLTRWLASGEEVKNVFSRQALAMVWDFSETNPLSEVSRSWSSAIVSIENVLTAISSGQLHIGQVQQSDACQSALPADAVNVYFTDPPYYDAIPYADLSDFFFVWLKRALPRHAFLRDPYDSENVLTPKIPECVWNKSYAYNGRPKDKMFFEETMARAFCEGRRILSENGVGSVVFAHQTTEGWEAFLGGLIAARWTVTASWPIATEMASRIRARENSSLATSVHLVCRPRPDDAGVGDWGVVLRELPKRVGDWMERLQGEGVRGADLVFACIGPALEIFSRYSKVETAEGREVALAEYFEKVWEVVGRSALAQVLGTAEARARNGAAGAVEEDARLTALFLWTLQSTSTGKAEAESETEDEEDAADDEDDEESSASGGKAKGFTLVFDVVRRFAQPLGIELPKWEGRVIETKKGVVRLLPIAERAKQLFGEDGAQAVAARLEQEGAAGTNALQGMLFPEMNPDAPQVRVRGRKRSARAGAQVSDENLAAARQATTLDRIHAAMLLQASGRTNALRALLKAEQERGADFLRLANALSALYPKTREEKRLLDAMLLAVPR